MTIKTLAAVVGTLAIIVALFFVTKITTPSRFLAKAGFFGSSSTDDWGGGTGRWFLGTLPGRGPRRAEASVSNCCRSSQSWSRFALTT